MPTNSNYDGYFTGVGGVPIFTYGMITITSIVLAYMTYMDPYIAEETTEPILEATSMDGVIESNPLDTTGALPEEVMPEEQQPQEEEEQVQGEGQGEQEQQGQEEQVQEQQQQKEDEQKPPVAGGKRKKRSTRRSRPFGKNH